MAIEVTNWQIKGSDSQTIYGNTHLPKTDPVGVLICCHGFKGYKDYGFLPVLCDHAARHGLIAHRFNFSHSGMTNKIETFERPDLFEKDRWGRQVDDLHAVQGAINRGELAGDALAPIWFGHSRGGVTATLAAAMRTTSHGPSALSPDGLITAASPDYAINLDDLVKDQLRAEGRLLSPSGRTGQDLYVGLDWLEEIERDPELYDPVLAAAQVTCPMLILHGDEDPTVPLACAHNLHRAATPKSRLEIIAGANHVYNCPNPAPDGPYASLPVQTRKLIDLSVAFAVACCDAGPSKD